MRYICKKHQFGMGRFFQLVRKLYQLVTLLFQLLLLLEEFLIQTVLGAK